MRRVVWSAFMIVFAGENNYGQRRRRVKYKTTYYYRHAYFGIIARYRRTFEYRYRVAVIQETGVFILPFVPISSLNCRVRVHFSKLFIITRDFPTEIYHVHVRMHYGDDTYVSGTPVIARHGDWKRVRPKLLIPYTRACFHSPPHRSENERGH